MSRVLVIYFYFLEDLRESETTWDFFEKFKNLNFCMIAVTQKLCLYNSEMDS